MSPLNDPLATRQAITGALVSIGGLIIRLLVQVKTALVDRLTGDAYVVSTDGGEQSFKSKQVAYARITELLSAGITANRLKLFRLETRTQTDGSGVVREIDLSLTEG